MFAQARQVMALMVVFVVMAYLPISATIINVPDDYGTIQEGIDASTDGDTVLVQPETYIENINFNGHNIVLGSLFLTTGDTSYIRHTVISGTGSGAVINIESGEDSTAIVAGFAIRNAEIGIRCENSSPSIINNSITDHYSEGEFYEAFAGGIYCLNSHGKILNNFIANISAVHWGDSGVGHPYGVGIYCDESNPLIENNVIINNWASALFVLSRGAGIFCKGTSSPTIKNNTISRNISYNDQYHGGGIYLEYGSPIIINTIIWCNFPNEIWEPYEETDVSYCNIYGGYEGESIINTNPIFTEPGQGDYNIFDQSPCLDAGDPDYSDPDGTRSDIGAYFSSHPEFGDGEILYVSSTGNNESGNGSIDNPYRTIQFSIDQSITYDTVLVLPGEYHENISIENKALTLTSNFILSNDSSDIYNTVLWSQFYSHGNILIELCDDMTVVEGFTLGHPNATGSAIMCSRAHPIIRNNIMTDNNCVNGGGIRLEYSNAYIYNNIICLNHVAINGGGIYCLYSTPIIEGNLIYGNEAPGGNGKGGGIFCQVCSPIIINNTIVDNQSPLGSGICCAGSCHPIVVNTILWLNSYPHINGGAPVITFSNIQGGYNGQGNINLDPMFVNPDSADFHLLAGSPCIDAGDPNSPPDPDSTRADIGAFFFDQSTNIKEIYPLPLQFSLSQNYPNPFNPITTISFTIEHPQFVTLKVYDLLGREVQALIDEDRLPGQHAVAFDASDLSSGIYFYRLQAGDIAESKRMVLLK